MTAPPKVSLHGVSKWFGGVPALQEVSFEILPGEIHAIVGENGAGKSTLMKLLAGVHQPDAGEFQMDGQVVRFNSPRAAQQSGISIVFQELNLFPHRTVTANLFVQRELRTPWGMLDSKEMRSIASKILIELESDISPDAVVGTLTLAQQQQVEIARALYQRSQVLILDEPNSALSAIESRRLFQCIHRLRANGVTQLYVSHRLEEVFELADRITVLRDGRYCGTHHIAQTTVPQIIQTMVGTQSAVVSTPPLNRHQRTDPMLVVDNLTLHDSLGPVSFTACRGEILGIAGMEGSGVDDLFLGLFGLKKATSGEIRVEGKSVRWNSPADAIRHGFALIPRSRRDEGLMLDRPISFNATLLILNQLRNAIGLMSRNRVFEATRSTLTELGMDSKSPDEPVSKLSGGNQQKVLLTKWLATHPKFLLLNDPTRGVDIGAKREIYALCRTLAASGMILILASSETDEILDLSDRILVFAHGTIRAEFTRGAVSKAALIDAMIGSAEMLPNGPLAG